MTGVTKKSWATIGEQPLDICNCPEIEELSLSVRGILEEAYANQGELPPFSFDEFTVTLALQLQAETSSSCLETISEDPLAFSAAGGGASNPFPEHSILDAQGNPIPGLGMLNYREATLSGRYAVFHAEVNGDPQVFVLRRNEDGQVTVSSHVPRLNVEALDFGPEPGRVNVFRPNDLVISGSQQIVENPTTGEEFLSGERRIQRTFDGRHNLQFSGELAGNEAADTLSFGAGTVLSFDIDGRNDTGATADEFEDPNNPGPVAGTELELRAEVSGTLSATTGDLLQRELSYGATLFGDDNRALRFDVDETLYTDPRYQLQYGNAGDEGELIDGVISLGSIQRPSINGAGVSLSGGGSGGKGEDTAAAASVEGGLAPQAPDDGNLFHLGVTGEFDENPSAFEFSLAQTDGEDFRYLSFDRDIDRDSFSLLAGAGDEDSRFNFQLDESVYGGRDASALYQWGADLPEEREGSREYTLGVSHDGNPYGDDVTELSFDVAQSETETGAYINGDQRMITDRRVFNGEVATDGSALLSFESVTREGQVREIVQRNPDGSPGGMSSEEVAHYERAFGTSLELLEGSGYTVAGHFSETYGSALGTEGYQIGLSHTEVRDGTVTSAELSLVDSEGVAGSPCESLDMVFTLSEYDGRAPAGASPGGGFGQSGGTQCGVHLQRTNGFDHYSAFYRDSEQIGTSGVLSQQFTVGNRQNGESFADANIGFNMTFNSGSWVRN